MCLEMTMTQSMEQVTLVEGGSSCSLIQAVVKHHFLMII